MSDCIPTVLVQERGRAQERAGEKRDLDYTSFSRSATPLPAVNTCFLRSCCVINKLGFPPPGFGHHGHKYRPRQPQRGEAEEAALSARAVLPRRPEQLRPLRSGQLLPGGRLLPYKVRQRGESPRLHLASIVHVSRGIRGRERQVHAVLSELLRRRQIHSGLRGQLCRVVRGVCGVRCWFLQRELCWRRARRLLRVPSRHLRARHWVPRRVCCVRRGVRRGDVRGRLRRGLPGDLRGVR
jgi:hypothetical protein